MPPAPPAPPLPPLPPVPVVDVELELDVDVDVEVDVEVDVVVDVSVEVELDVDPGPLVAPPAPDVALFEPHPTATPKPTASQASEPMRMRSIIANDEATAQTKAARPSLLVAR